jgi:hypothetical protein
MRLAWLIGIPVAIFGVGSVVGYAASKRGVPPDEIGRWLLKESTRKGLRAYDQVLEALPDQDPIPLSQELAALPAGQSGGEP